MSLLSCELRSNLRDDNLHDIIPILERLYTSRHPPPKPFLNWAREDVMMEVGGRVNALTIEKIVSFLEKNQRESQFNSSLGTDAEDSDLLMDSVSLFVLLFIIMLFVCWFILMFVSLFVCLFTNFLRKWTIITINSPNFQLFSSNSMLAYIVMYCKLSYLCTISNIVYLLV